MKTHQILIKTTFITNLTSILQRFFLVFLIISQYFLDFSLSKSPNLRKFRGFPAVFREKARFRETFLRNRENQRFLGKI